MIQDAVNNVDGSSENARTRDRITDAPESTTSEQTHAAPEWQPNNLYKIGDQVTYGHANYVCIQAHTALVGWEPPRTPALWVRVTLEEPEEPGTPPTTTDLSSFRKRSLLLPTETTLKSILASPDPEDGGGDRDEEIAKSAKTLIDRHTRTKAAITELTRIDATHIKKSVMDEAEEVKIDESLSITKSITDQIKHVTQLRAVNIDQFKAAAERVGTTPGGTAPGVSASSGTLTIGMGQTDPLALQDVAGTASAVGLARQLAVSSLGMLGAPAFKPVEFKDSILTLNDDTPLSETTQRVLTSLDVNPSITGLPGKTPLLVASRAGSLLQMD